MNYKRKRINKKGQFDFPIITFAIIGIILIIVLVMGFKILNSFVEPVSNVFGGLNGGQQANQSVMKMKGQAITFLDQGYLLIIIFMIIGVGLTLYFININPVWIFLFIVFSLVTVMVVPNLLSLPETILQRPSFATENSQLTTVNFIESNFIYIIIGIIVLSGVLLYGKIGGGRSE